MKKKLITLMCFVALFSVVTLKAQTVSTWDGSAAIWTQGSGTQADPYLIERAQNLAWIAEMVNGGVTTYAGVWFKLTSDLNMNNVAWVPIGNSTSNLFRGKFDGDNHFIDNISITSNYPYSGLFGITGDGFRCENLGVKTNMDGTNHTGYAGGIVGYINGANTVIQNCYNAGSVKGEYVGGIAGWTKKSGVEIVSCYNIGVCSGRGSCGGIVGDCTSSTLITQCYNEGDVSFSANNDVYTLYAGGIAGANGTITYCYNEGNISFSIGRGASQSVVFPVEVMTCVGGIRGYGSGSIKYCHNKGNVSSSSHVNHWSSNSSGHTATAYAGGIAGYTTNGETYNNNWNTGNITSTAYTFSVTYNSYNSSACNQTAISGGIIGFTGNTSSNNSTTISNSFNRGNVTSASKTYSNNVRKSGGIVGNGSCTIQNCYNTGTLSGDVLGGIQSSGYGIATITNCYYLNTCGGSMVGGISQTETVMKSSAFPSLLNADSTVFVMDGIPNINDGYPVFGSVSSRAATQISFSKATIHGVYDINADVVGFQYKKTSESDYTTVYTNVGTPTSYQLSNLQSGTQYTFRFFVQKDGVTYNGQTLIFTTLACDLQATITKSTTTICQGDTASFTVACSSNYSNAFTYEWNNGSTDTSIIVTNDASYSIIVHDTNGCSASASASVTVNPVPQGHISGNMTLCSGQSTTLTASGANSYHWSTGATAPVITVTSSGNYVCTFTNSYGCTSSQCVIVNVFSAPTITGNTSFCSGGYTTLTATGGDSYQWSTGATSATINVNTAGNYSVTASTSNGCSGSTSVNVVENQPVNVTITGNSVICNETSTTLTATSGASYLWSSGETTQSISVNTPGSYSVTVTNTNGCSGSSSQTVTMMESAVISGNTHICEGESATLSVSGAGTYTWSNGAYTSSITVGTPGTYTVTASLPNGCSSTASAEVTVATTPTPTILGNTTLCQGQSTSLSANGGVSYHWSNGSSNNNISVSQSGVYTVTATNAEGCSNTANVTVTVNPLPNVNISGNSSFCQGDNVMLTATGASTYTWSNSQSQATITVSNPGTYTVTGTDANGCSNIATRVVTANPVYNISQTQSICQGQSYLFNGQYLTTSGTYTQNLSTVNGCDSIVTLTLTVKSLPTPVILGNTTLCQGQSTSLSANGGVSYAWSNGSSSNNISVSQSGVYTVTATNAEGCSAAASVTVTVNPLPSVSISGNSSFCQGDNVTLTATGASTYVWSNASSNAAITVSNAGTYTVTGTDANGCNNTATKTVSVNPTYNIPLTHSICQGESYNFYGQNLTAAGTYTHTLQTVNGCDSVLTLTLMVKALPTPTLTGNTSLCEGETTTLIANGGVSYVWNNASTGNSISVSQSGVYTVTATNAEGCSAPASVTVTVNLLPNVNINGNNSFCQGDNITLTATGANTYAWSNASTNTSITVSNAGTYTVTGTDANGCSNIATKTVSVNPTYNVPLTHSICQGESYNFYGQNLTTAGTYTHTLQTVNGCDSVLTLSLSVKALPTPTITGNTSLCEGETTTLTANGGVSYAWSNAATANSINVSQSGVYIVTATNAEGCSAPASVTVTVNPLPTITISGNTTLCAGNSTTLTASGADSYSWSTGDNTASVSISAFGVYTVTGATTAGCSGTANVTVLVSQLPVITISGETDICAGESTTLTANGGETYLWSDGTTANTLTVGMAGSYQVIGYNAAGCDAMASTTVNVWQSATSEFTIECPDSCYIWNGESYCQSGDYTQTFQTIHGCDSVVTLHLTITVGIDDQDLATSMTVYPNPTTSVINVQFTINNVPAETMEIWLYDAYGKLLNVVAANNDETVQIDLSRFAPGVYFIKAVAEGNVVAVRKVVKQ